MLKIVVIGAGHGGLQAAKVLADGGYDVTVFERGSKDKLSRDRWDTIEPAVFEDLNIPLPEGTFKDAACAFTAPFSYKPLIIDLPEEKRDWTVDRRLLAIQLADSAEKEGAKIYYETPVEKLIFDNTGVIGVIVAGEKIYTDLVIDASGVFSPFRRSLPKRFGITSDPEPDDVFYTWDAMFTQTDGIDAPKDYNFLMHLKYNGEKCIAWCVPEFEDKYAAFIGKAGGLSDEDFDRLNGKLRNDYPWLGTKLIRGGDRAEIPIRYPLTKMVAQGYAAVGDSAFMTVPLLGVGVANSLRAGQMLADAIKDADSVSINTLWDYQVRYYNEIGSGSFFIEKLKRALLNSDNDLLLSFFEGGIISNEELKSLIDGKITLISVKDLISRIKKAYEVKHLFGSLMRAALSGYSAMKAASSIPKKYDPLKIAGWKQKIDKIMEQK